MNVQKEMKIDKAGRPPLTIYVAAEEYELIFSPA